MDENTELGRITLPIAMGMKAKILVYAASPLFNGNPDYIGFTNKDGTPLFNTTYSTQKWERAAAACKEAIDKAHALGYMLYEFQPTLLTGQISEETRIHLNCRGTVTERWNTEIIWANTSSTTRHMQTWCAPRGLNNAQRAYSGSNGSYGVTMKVANLFYTKNGVPIDEDVSWDYNNRFNCGLVPMLKCTPSKKGMLQQNSILTGNHASMDRWDLTEASGMEMAITTMQIPTGLRQRLANS